MSVADDPGRYRQAVHLGSGVQLAQGSAASDPSAARRRIDLNVAQWTEVDHQAAVTDCGTRGVVEAAAY